MNEKNKEIIDTIELLQDRLITINNDIKEIKMLIEVLEFTKSNLSSENSRYKDFIVNKINNSIYDKLSLNLEKNYILGEIYITEDKLNSKL